MQLQFWSFSELISHNLLGEGISEIFPEFRSELTAFHSISVTALILRTGAEKASFSEKCAPKGVCREVHFVLCPLKFFWSSIV